MISPEDFFEILKANGITFFTGVPDSLLKDFCSYITDNSHKQDHIINSNEGASIALASGYYISTGKPALVYMQNSGLGNAVNPLLSLADKEVYSIPMLLMIGWRGEPGKKDEPQHIKQGRVILKMLDAMEIQYDVIDASTVNVKEKIEKACSNILEKNCPYALIISAGTFEEYSLKNEAVTDYPLNREDAIKIILDNLSHEDIVVSTTGKTSREVFEYREKKNQGHQNDFLTVGSMGHCSMIALGIALKNVKKKVYVLDGDGAAIMQMGSLAITGTHAPENFKHIIINNGAHDSVGGQPTVGFQIDFSSIANACGYKLSLKSETAAQIKEELTKLIESKGPSLLEIRVNKGSRKDLGRPATAPVENKKILMEFLSK
ncbi:MAG: phosphonopyruvate decarboxylase [Bacteroidota bacterium]|nr:phosphonopyruvate decarboxylase [Bacteroidota bacterium]